jgi:hypothetical protein
VSDAGSVILLTLSALLPMVDPLIRSPEARLFLAMTQGYSPETRRVLALRVALNSLTLMVGSYFVGALILIRDMLRLKVDEQRILDSTRSPHRERVHALCGAAHPHPLRVSLPRPGRNRYVVWRCSR